MTFSSCIKPSVFKRIIGVAEESAETWECTEIKVKEMLAQNLQVESSSIIERPHRMTRKQMVLLNQEQFVQQEE